MPTLFRLIFVMGLLGLSGYAMLYAVANLVKPQERAIVEAIALPQSATEVHTGRSVAEVLNHQASALVRQRKHRVN